jgi:GntR family transcriptional regulator
MVTTPEGAPRPVSASPECAVTLHGFAAVPARLVADRSISHTELRLLLALAAHAGPEQECWPGVERLAAIVGLTGRQVRRVLRSLEKSGFVQVFKRERQDGTQTSNLYRLRFARWDESGNPEDGGVPGGQLITADDQDKNVRQGDPNPLASEGDLSEPVPFDISARMTRAERRRVENLETAHRQGKRCLACHQDFDALNDYLLAGKLARYGGQLVSGVVAFKRSGVLLGYAHNECVSHPATVYEVDSTPNPASPWESNIKVKS